MTASEAIGNGTEPVLPVGTAKAVGAAKPAGTAKEAADAAPAAHGPLPRKASDGEGAPSTDGRAPEGESGLPAAVSVLGAGPMGRALASAFLAAGHPVTIWNRTPGKVRDLVERGAGQAESVADAVRAGRVVVACLVDYAAVRATLAEVPDGPAGSWAGRHLVNLSSGEPAEAREASAWAGARGIAYLDGAILTPTAAMGTSAAAVLYSGSQDVYRAVRGTARSLGGTATYLGEDPGRATAHDVALLDVFATSVLGIAHAFALAAAEGIEPEPFARFASGIGALLPQMISRFAAQIQADRFPGDRSTIASAASAIGHIVSAAGAHGLDVGMLTAGRSVLNRAVAAGHGEEGLARLAVILRNDR